MDRQKGQGFKSSVLQNKNCKKQKAKVLMHALLSVKLSKDYQNMYVSTFFFYSFSFQKNDIF